MVALGEGVLLSRIKVTKRVWLAKVTVVVVSIAVYHNGKAYGVWFDPNKQIAYTVRTDGGVEFHSANDQENVDKVERAQAMRKIVDALRLPTK